MRASGTIDRDPAAPRAGQPRRVTVAAHMTLWLCFTMSGAAALALEMLWMRSAALVLGQTAATTASVLACYFAGLGLGAAAGRGIRRQAVRAYGVLELGAAAGALWSVHVFRALGAAGAQQWLAAGGPAARIAAVAIAVVPATACLGATLPALGQVLAARALGRRGGLLYALNTLGGVAGIVAAGFGLPALIGVHASYVVAAAASAVAGAAALIVGCGGAVALAPTAVAGTTQSGVSRHRLRVAAAGAGALGLGLEVLWTRLFAQVLHNSVYSFSAIALVFVMAIAAGATLAALVQPRLRPVAIARTALIAAGVATIAGFWLFVRYTDGLAYFGMESGLGEYLARIIALAALTAGPAAFAAGVVLPALWGAWGGHDAAARPLGDLSAANTLGGIAGALVAAFVALPLLGLCGCLLAAAAAYIVLADVLAPPRCRWRPMTYGALVVVVLANPMRAPLVHLRPDTETVRATLEGPNGIVTVVESQDDLQLRLDNYYVLGGTAAATNERRLGVLPLLLHPAPHRVAFVGLATGITASAGPALGIDETTVVELVPEVAVAARAHFAEWNGHLFERRNVRVVVDDGRRYLAASRQHFDVIVSDLFIPWHAGAGSLYSREMYETVAQRLAPGGLFCQWLPLYQLTRGEFDMIAHTFLTVFPHVGLWRADFYPNRPVVGLVGQSTVQAVDLTRIGERLERLPDWSEDPLLAAPRALAMLSVGPLTPVADLFAATPLNTDDHPLLEFAAPRLTRINATGDKDWFTGAALATFYETLAERTAATPDPMLPQTADVDEARGAGAMLYRYALAASHGDSTTAAQLQADVRALVPDVIRSAESAEVLTDLATARRTLAKLRAEQEQMQRRIEEVERRLGQLDHSGETESEGE
jgi:spermidine synthase